MELECGENLSVALSIATVVICITCTAMHGCHEYQLTEREAIQAGLEQQLLPSSNAVVWSRSQSQLQSRQDRQ